MKNKMLKKGLAIGMSAFLLASSLAPVSVQAASWKQNKTGWWWQEDNGSYPVSQWKVINGKWYAFDARGLSLIHISEPTRPCNLSRMPSSA